MLGSSILVTLATLLVSAINFLSQVVLAWKFGASSSMDTYLLAISFPMFVSGVLSVGLSYSLVPALVNFQHQRDSYRHFSGLLFISFLLLAFLIGSVGCLLTPFQIAILGPLLSDLEATQAIEIARVSWVTAGVMVLIGYLRGLHNAGQQFLLATLASAVPPLCVIIAGLLVGAPGGATYISWAMLVGFVLLIPLLLVHSHSDITLSPRNIQAYPAVRDYLGQLPLIILAVLCFTAFQASDSYWAPRLGEGQLSHLSYCQRLVVSLGNLVIAGPAAVLLPKLAIAHTEGRTQDFFAYTQCVIRMVLACSLPVAAYASVLAEPAVRLFFERGAFDQQATKDVAVLLPWMMLGMVPMLCVVVIFRAIFARQEVLWAAILGTLTFVIYFSFSGWMSQSFGASGIAMAYTCTWWTIFILSICVLWRGRLKQLAHSGNAKFICKLILALCVTGGLGLASSDWVSHSDAIGIPLAMRLGLVGLVGAMLYVILAVGIRIDEIRLLFFYMFHKLGLSEKISRLGQP